MIRSLAKRWWYLLVLAVLAARAIPRASDGYPLVTPLHILAILGMGMNVLVILLNDGMPARVRLEEIPEGEREDYKPIDASTRAALLADWIAIRDYLISPGDILIAVGVFGGIVQLLLG